MLRGIAAGALAAVLVVGATGCTSCSKQTSGKAPSAVVSRSAKGPRPTGSLELEAPGPDNSEGPEEGLLDEATPGDAIPWQNEDPGVDAPGPGGDEGDLGFDAPGPGSEGEDAGVDVPGPGGGDLGGDVGGSGSEEDSGSQSDGGGDSRGSGSGTGSGGTGSGGSSEGQPPATVPPISDLPDVSGFTKVEQRPSNTTLMGAYTDGAAGVVEVYAFQRHMGEQEVLDFFGAGARSTRDGITCGTSAQGQGLCVNVGQRPYAVTSRTIDTHRLVGIVRDLSGKL